MSGSATGELLSTNFRITLTDMKSVRPRSGDNRYFERERLEYEQRLKKTEAAIQTKLNQFRDKKEISWIAFQAQDAINPILLEVLAITPDAKELRIQLRVTEKPSNQSRKKLKTFLLKIYEN